MKTNEAPDKIYIQRFNVSEEDAKFKRVLYFDDIWTEEPEPGCENVEYTRTDVFIDKACDWLNNNLTKYSELTNEDEYGNKLKETVMNVFYGQAVKDFQAYMKGE